MTYQKSINIIILLTFSFYLHAQTSFERSIDLEFVKNGNPIELALCGGFNNPQFNEADLNQDGIMDLVIFDRNDDKVITFLNNGIENEISYEYAPEYEKFFPEMKGYMILRDFNCDGIADLFTPINFDVAYYEGGFDSDGNPTFNLINEKLTYFSEENLPIEIADTDYPEIRDIDSDGLLDILTFNEDIGGTVNFFKNVSSLCGGLDFINADTCWGDFYESGNAAIVELNYCGGGKRPNKHERHPGSTLLTIDLDNDGDLELLTGDINSNALTLLVNGGDANDALITDTDVTFPSYNQPVDLLSFPASFYLDINNDGKKDFLASPNSKNASETLRSSWMYINTGSNETPQFNFVTDRFLTSETLDYGTQSKPCFVDINADGLTDLLVGNFSSREFAGGAQQISSLSYYENIGTSAAPIFDLKTNDWAGLSQLNVQGLHPTFGDLDGDGAIDMICGMNGEAFPTGQDLNGKLFYFKNAAPAGQPFELSFPLILQDTIDVGQASAPQLVDVNEDGLLDLIVGEFRGKVNYFKNIGTSTNPIFEFTSDIWGNFDVKDPEGSGKGYSVPKLIKLDNEETWTLIVGSFDGSYYVYKDIEENAENSGSFTLVDNNLGNINDTQHSAPDFADINNDGNLEMVSGSKRGGLMYYTSFIDSTETNINSINLATENILIYPNPTQDFVNFETKNSILSVSFYDVKGALIKTNNSVNTNRISISNFSNGIYFAKIKLNNGTELMKKIVKY